MSKEELNLRRIEEEARKNREAAWKMRSIVSDILDAVHNAVTALRVLVYLGSVAGAWFYMKDRTLAVGIVSALTCAHLLIWLMEYVEEKKREISESFK